jgi:hypothetical protein
LRFAAPGWTCLGKAEIMGLPIGVSLCQESKGWTCFYLFYLFLLSHLTSHLIPLFLSPQFVSSSRFPKSCYKLVVDPCIIHINPFKIHIKSI